MRVYVCDACQSVMEKPYDVKMKEFYVGIDFDYGMAFPRKGIRRTKIHLCDDCYKSLKNLANKKEKDDE